MGRKTAWGVAAAALMLGLPAVASAQAQSMKDFQVADVDDMKGKFVGLAEAFPEDKYAWEPMEGVRSVREVIQLAVAEAHVFPAMWGAAPAPGAGAGFRPEMERLASLSRDQLIAELGGSFDYLSQALAGMSDAARMADGTTFGRAMKNDAGIALAMSDMHEHLGQLIAYARMNHIVPPWSN